jgi:geranylgeranyl pyrophosphate synthase
MKTSQLSAQVLKDFTQARIQLNERLNGRIKELYPHAFFAQEIWRRIEKGRKIRSLLLLATVKALDPSISEDDFEVLDVCLGIEMVHAASCLVDDILDGDDIRHGYQSSHAILGTPVAVLQSHFLCAEVFNLLRHQRLVPVLLIDTYQKLTLGGMYDIFLPEPTGEWMCKGYTEQVYQKTSAMFEFSLESAAIVARRYAERNRLKLLGNSIGKLYQLSNDYFDMQPENIRRRHAADHSWRVTFSLPLACYLQINGSDSIQGELKKGILTYDEWMDLLRKIWNNEVRDACKKMIADTERETRDRIKSSGMSVPVQSQFLGLSELVLQEEFWYHSYAE